MASQKAATIKDVAQRAGVSLMTVSAVLSGKAAERRISAETQRRVAEIARLMEYRPNGIARSLRRQSTNIIGLYSGIGYLNASHPFLAELIGGLQEGCDLHRKDLLLHGTFRGRSADDIYAELLDGRLDGLIVQARPADALVDRLAESHLPVIAVVDAIPSVPSVVADDVGGARALFDYLAGKGHRRFVFFGAGSGIMSAVRRQVAFRSAAARTGLTVREWTGDSLRALDGTPVEQWLFGPPEERPTAAVCWSDNAAYEFLAFCRDRGLRVPEDIAVTGFDGFPAPPAIVRRLTTIRAPWGDVARRAVTLLAEMLEGREAPVETVVPVELVAGDTA